MVVVVACNLLRPQQEPISHGVAPGQQGQYSQVSSTAKIWHQETKTLKTLKMDHYRIRLLSQINPFKTQRLRPGRLRLCCAACEPFERLRYQKLVS